METVKNLAKGLGKISQKIENYIFHQTFQAHGFCQKHKNYVEVPQALGFAEL